VGFSLATTTDKAAWVWSPATFIAAGTSASELALRTPSDSFLRIGRATSDTAMAGSEATTALVMKPLTRPGIGWDATSGFFHIGYIDAAGLVRIYRITNAAPPAISTLVRTVTISLPNYDGAVVTVINASEFWVSYLNNGLHVRRYDLGSLSSEYVLSTSSTLTPTSCSSTTVVASGLNRVIFYEGDVGVSSVRIVSSDALSEPMGVLGADRDYSFHSVRVTGVTALSNGYLAVVEHGIEGSDTIVSSYFTGLLWSKDCQTWYDWVGAAAFSIRGSAYVLGSKIGLADMGTLCESPGTVRTENPTWIEMGNVSSWTYESSFSSLSGVGSVQSGDGVNANLPSVGDMVKLYVTVDGAEFCYATASVDVPARNVDKTGTAVSIQLRGPLKGMVDYKSAVDDFFPSGDARSIDFSLMSVVPKLGTLSVADGLATVDSVDPIALHGLSIVPEEVSGEFSYAVRMGHFVEGTGMVLFFEDTDNYLFLIYIGGKYRIYQYVDGVTGSSLYAVDKNVADVPYLMVVYRSGVLNLYVSRPSTITDRPDEIYSAEWVKIGEYSYAPSVKSWNLGIVGPAGSQFRHLYIKEHGYQQTIGRLSSKIAARCGVELAVSPVIEDAGPISATTSYTSIVSNLDLDFVANFTAGGNVGVRFGPGSGAIEDGGIYLKIEQNKLSIQTSSGSAWETVATLVLVAIDDLITNGSNMRVTIMRSDEKTVVLGVYKQGKYLWSTQVPSGVNRGKLTLSSTGTVTNIVAHGLSYPILDHVWQVGTPGIDEVKRLVGTMLWNVVEGPDRTALLVPPTHNRGECGNVDGTSEVRNHVPDDRQWRSVIKVVGAEVYHVHIDPRTILRGVRVEEYDSPYLWSTEECAWLAGGISDYIYSAIDAKTIRGFLDPRVEPFDRIVANGDREIVTSVTATVVNTRMPSATMEVKTRREL